jgi:hypothetical protein
MNYKLSPESSPLDEKQFVVSESPLYQILSICQYCCSEATPYIQYTKGTLISTTSVCINSHISMWKRQPSHNSMHWSNLMTATAIMCSGVNAATNYKLFLVKWRWFRTKFVIHLLNPVIIVVIIGWTLGQTSWQQQPSCVVVSTWQKLWRCLSTWTSRCSLHALIPDSSHYMLHHLLQ